MEVFWFVHYFLSSYFFSYLLEDAGIGLYLKNYFVYKLILPHFYSWFADNTYDPTSLSSTYETPVPLYQTT